MALTKQDYIKPALTSGGLSHVLRPAAELASFNYKKGCPLVSSSGYVTVATSAAVVDVVGISAEDGHNGASNGLYDLTYYPVAPHTEWIGCIYSATPASAVLAQSHLFGNYGFIYNSTYAIWMVDLDEATAAQKCVHIVELVDAVGTQYGKVKFMFNEYGLLTDGLK